MNRRFAAMEVLAIDAQRRHFSLGRGVESATKVRECGVEEPSSALGEI